MTKIKTLYCVKFLGVVWWFNKFTWGLTVCNEHMRSFVKITVCVYAASNRTKLERVSFHHQLGKHDLATICVNSTLLPCKHVLWNNLLISEYDSFAFMAVLVPVRGVGYVFLLWYIRSNIWFWYVLYKNNSKIFVGSKHIHIGDLSTISQLYVHSTKRECSLVFRVLTNHALLPNCHITIPDSRFRRTACRYWMW